MANPFCHVELHANDIDKAKDFYSELFDWELQDVPMGESTYTMIQVGEGLGGGMMSNPAPQTGSHWMSYVNVDDIVESTRKAGELGANVVQEVTEIPGYGSFSIIADPVGAVVGLWQAA